MIREIVKKLQNDDVNYVELSGLSTDEKPTGICTGSVFLEVDTTKVYFFDEASGEWLEAGGGE